MTNTRDIPRRLLTLAVRRMPAARRDWGAAMLAELAQLRDPLTRWRFALGCVQVALFSSLEGGLMTDTIKKIFANPSAAALIGFILSLPLPFILLVAWFEIEPLQSHLKYWFTERGSSRNNTFAIIVLLGSLSLLPLATVITLRPAVRRLREGAGIAANSVNLLLGAAILVFLTTIVLVFVIDQYPCWIGVPNCD